MKEKILIKSVMDKKAMTVFRAMIGTLLSVASILFLTLLVKKEYKSSYFGTYLDTGLHQALIEGNGSALATFIVSCSLFLLGFVVLIVYLVHRKCEITVTEKNVRGKAILGKEVVLPIDMISAYSTRSFMSTIAVSTSSCLTKFALIGNYAEIGNVLSTMINERQENTVKVENNINASNSNMEDIVKLKNLLDMGIITQEEFDAKKKQLLGL